MDAQKLATAIRNHAQTLKNPTQISLVETSTLLFVLARIVEGMPVERSFAQDADWFEGTEIGRCLNGK